MVKNRVSVLGVLGCVALSGGASYPRGAASIARFWNNCFVPKLVAILEKFQIPLYIFALLLGALIGLTIPDAAHPATLSLSPVIGVLLYVTFLGVPVRSIFNFEKRVRFFVALIAVNFVVVPAVVFVLTRFIAADQVLLVGVLFVLLTPCVDYVITFTGLAGGDRSKLLSATPLLMLLQMLLLPIYIWMILGSEFASIINLAPFVEAFLLLILLPLLLASLTQILAARFRLWRGVYSFFSSLMVPLMMLTLAVVVISQIRAVSSQLSSLLVLLPIYLAFAAVMLVLGWALSRALKLPVPEQRAITFSGITRNSLVVLPLVLALPIGFELASLAVVTQTLLELLVMVLLVWLIPRLIR